MRISDWSSDVCSSDLTDRHDPVDRLVEILPALQSHLGTAIGGSPVVQQLTGITVLIAAEGESDDVHVVFLYCVEQGRSPTATEIGRASRRARVCQYV